MKIIDGRLISKEIREDLKKEIDHLKKKNIIPGLGILLVGNDPASEIYVRNKMKTCDELGLHVQLYRFTEENTEEEILAQIQLLNEDETIDGILIQSPLPKC